MRKAPALIVVLLALVTAGCVLSGKPGKPAVATPVAPSPVVNTPPVPPPQPLSIPQTQVDLPKPQPVDQAALAPDPPPPVQTPAETSTQPLPGPGRPPRAGSQQPTAPASPAPTNPQPAATPPVTTPAEAPIQEIIPAADLKRYSEQAQGRWKEIQTILDQLVKRRLTPAQDNVVTNIKSWLGSSQALEKKGDMKSADALAERALVLARDLLNGK